MLNGKMPWMKPLLASLLAHGVILLLIGFAPTGQSRSAVFEVSLTADEVFAHGSAKGRRGTAIHAGGEEMTKRQGRDRAETQGKQGCKVLQSVAGTSLIDGKNIDDNRSTTIHNTVPSASLQQAALNGSSRNNSAEEMGVKGSTLGTHGNGTEGSNSGNGRYAGAGGATDADGVEFEGPGGPRFVHRETPEYPLYARRRKKEGKVVLMVRITEQGRLSGIEVVTASDSIFVEPSLEAVKRSTFAPARHNGVPVPTKAILPIRFVLNEQKSLAR